MISLARDEKIGVLLSGGLDSSILFAHLLDRGRTVQPFYVATDVVWRDMELAAATRFVESCRGHKGQLVTLELPLADLYGDHWSISGAATPAADSPDESVFLPGRNALLVMKAAIWCQLNGIPALALAPLGTSPFADASREFFARLESAFCLTGSRIKIVCPFRQLSKRDVMQLGRAYDLRATFSCIAPVGPLHCGRCNKCAERQRAFGSVGVEDPTLYAEMQPSRFE